MTDQYASRVKPGQPGRRDQPPEQHEAEPLLINDERWNSPQRIGDVQGLARAMPEKCLIPTGERPGGYHGEIGIGGP